MAGFLVIDTETSGLFDFTRPADAEGQPRLASVAMLLCDEQLEVEREYYTLVRPDGWEMPAQAEAINGLSTAKLLADGVDVYWPLLIYSAAIDGRIVMAYNAQYDLKIMRGALRRAGLPDRFDYTESTCVMQAMTDVCRILKPSGRGYKWPRLAEAHAHFFGDAHDGAHGALPDARACLRIAREMRYRGIDMPRKRAA